MHKSVILVLVLLVGVSLARNSRSSSESSSSQESSSDQDSDASSRDSKSRDSDTSESSRHHHRHGGSHHHHDHHGNNRVDHNNVDHNNVDHILERLSRETDESDSSSADSSIDEDDLREVDGLLAEWGGEHSTAAAAAVLSGLKGGEGKEEIDKFKANLKDKMSSIEASVNDAIENEIEEKPYQSVHDVIFRALVGQVLGEMRSDYKHLRASRKDLQKLKRKMKAAARDLHSRNNQGKYFDFRKLKKFLAYKKKFVEKKKEFILEVVEVKDKFVRALKVMSVIYQQRTGTVRDYLHVLGSVASNKTEVPSQIEAFYQDAAAQPPVATTDDVIDPGTEPPATTPSPANHTSGDPVSDILATVKNMKSDIYDKVSSAVEFKKSKVEEKIELMKNATESCSLAKDELPTVDIPQSVPSSDIVDIPPEVETGIDDVISSRVDDTPLNATDANDVIATGLIQQLVQGFASSIERLKDLKLDFLQSQAATVLELDSLRNALINGSVNITTDVFRSLLADLVRSKLDYVTQVAEIKAGIVETLKNMSQAFANRTGHAINYMQVIASLKNSSVELSPVFQEYLNDLNVAARADGLTLDVATAAEDDDSGVVLALSVVGAVVVLVAAAAGVVVLARRSGKKRLYSRFPE
ncbi:uncharacterized protein LOC131947081 [Physella acuta]|uniref:uncharacterized protein LOC131947081 n=1 Tax=Physella acuta TaxID=109671 RepID=UPI0027DCA772|nr:uncharacterized protein LOC131947081 [Physella acuta]